VAVGRATIALFCVLAIAGQSWPGHKPSAAVRPGEHRVSFQARNGLIYIPARVNGSRATLLLDTGAVLTTFSLKVAPATNTGSRITMNTANGSTPAFRVPVGFSIGESDPSESRSFRQTVVVGDFQFGDADGVIGLDVLSSFKVVTVDFQNSAVILQDR
jgi:predicted aspartyl protease